MPRGRDASPGSNARESRMKPATGHGRVPGEVDRDGRWAPRRGLPASRARAPHSHRTGAPRALGSGPGTGRPPSAVAATSRPPRSSSGSVHACSGATGRTSTPGTMVANALACAPDASRAPTVMRTGTSAHASAGTWMTSGTVSEAPAGMLTTSRESWTDHASSDVRAARVELLLGRRAAGDGQRALRPAARRSTSRRQCRRRPPASRVAASSSMAVTPSVNGSSRWRMRV